MAAGYGAGGARERWRDGIEQWRRAARGAAGHRPERYDDPQRAWVSSCFVSGMMMLFDRKVVEPASSELTADRYLADATERFGGLDAVILWHAYPRIGFDERNQFDFYRQVPGGVAGLRRLARRIQASGTRVLLAYYPWDTGTRREPPGEIEALARLVESCGADGVFLDTLAASSHDLQARLEAAQPGAVLVPEALVPLSRLADHAMSWLQWPPEDDRPYVLRNTWFEHRHMQHLIRRWHTDHRDELHLAWLNGAGVVVWENVFGSSNPWSDADAALLASMRPLQRHLGPLLAGARWQPFVQTSCAGLYASRWDGEGFSLWTLANANAEPVRGELLVLPPGAEQVVDLLSGGAAQVRSDASGTSSRPSGARSLLGELAAGGVGAFAAVAGEALATPLAALAGAIAGARRRPPAVAAAGAGELADCRDLAAPAAVGGAGVGAGLRAARTGAGAGTEPAPEAGATTPARAPFEATRRALRVEYRLRECGMDGPAPLLDSVYPELHGVVVEDREVCIGAFAVDVAPVTNAEFLVFLRDSGYRPAAPEGFLRHWPSLSGPLPEQSGEPVVHVDLGDATAYASWVGSRLPTPEEWQHALESGCAGYGSRRVWEWTESEQADGRTRWCVLKGGSDYEAPGSDWYADGGARRPSWRAKFLLAWPELDRCSTIGFRCASSTP